MPEIVSAEREAVSDLCLVGQRIRIPTVPENPELYIWVAQFDLLAILRRFRLHVRCTAYLYAHPASQPRLCN